MMRNRIRFVVALGAVLAAACGGGGDTGTTEAPSPEPTTAPTAGAPAPAGGGTGSIQGVISYANGDPDTPIQMNADPQCLALHTEPVTTETVVAEGGKLANVFVYLKEGAPAAGSPPADPVTLDQKGCQYHPHVSGIMVDQKLLIRNSDPTLHNIHALPTVNEEFNQGQPFQGMEMERTFTEPEVMVSFKCDVHPWMRSYMGVLDHPYYAVSGTDGSFTIGGLPAGSYTVEAWHETLGAQTQQVTVADGEAASLNFDFKPAA